MSKGPWRHNTVGGSQYLLTPVHFPIPLNLKVRGNVLELPPALYKPRLWILPALKPGRLVGLNTTRVEACITANITS